MLTYGHRVSNDVLDVQIYKSYLKTHRVNLNLMKTDQIQGTT